jgi:hypothetical protein
MESAAGELVKAWSNYEEERKVVIKHVNSNLLSNGGEGGNYPSHHPSTDCFSFKCLQCLGNQIDFKYFDKNKPK